MKKVIAVLLSVLMVFTAMSFVVYAEDDPLAEAPEATALPNDEGTTRNILNDEGLVVPVNKTQFKLALVFKIIEKMFKYVFGIFGSDADQSIADGIEDVGNWIDEWISNLDAGLQE